MPGRDPFRAAAIKFIFAADGARKHGAESLLESRGATTETNEIATIRYL